MKGGYVYIMSNEKRTTFYIGVTSDLKNKDCRSQEWNWFSIYNKV